MYPSREPRAFRIPWPFRGLTPWFYEKIMQIYWENRMEKNPPIWMWPGNDTNLVLSIMVFIRWAIVRTVQSTNFSLMVVCRKMSKILQLPAQPIGVSSQSTPTQCDSTCMRSSVSRSIAAVASSRTRIFVFRRRALAKQMSCLCPTLHTK